MEVTRKGCAEAQSGFTLLELMITLVIIGILASIAVPSYTEYLLRAKLLEAFNAMSDGRIKMEQFFQDNRRYAAAVDGETCPKKITDDISSGLKYFTIDCEATNETYELTATGASGSPTDGFVYTINDVNKKTTTGTITKWGKTSDICWIATASGSCY